MASMASVASVTLVASVIPMVPTASMMSMVFFPALKKAQQEWESVRYLQRPVSALPPETADVAGAALSHVAHYQTGVVDVTGAALSHVAHPSCPLRESGQHRADVAGAALSHVARCLLSIVHHAARHPTGVVDVALSHLDPVGVADAVLSHPVVCPLEIDGHHVDDGHHADGAHHHVRRRRQRFAGEQLQPGHHQVHDASWGEYRLGKSIL
jgi:hypothetical protein